MVILIYPLFFYLSLGRSPDCPEANFWEIRHLKPGFFHPNITHPTWNSAVMIPLLSCFEFHFLSYISKFSKYRMKPDYETIGIKNEQIRNIVIRK